MGKKPSVSTKLKIIALGQGKCYFEDCRKPLVDETGTNLAKIAHIFPRKKSQVRGDHPDFPPDLDTRNLPRNLIALCGTHHDIIDDPQNTSTYTVEYLQALKSRIEAKYYDKINVCKLDEKQEIGSEKFDNIKKALANTSSTIINGIQRRSKLSFITIHVFYEPKPDLKLPDLENATRVIKLFLSFEAKSSLFYKKSHTSDSIKYWEKITDDYYGEVLEASLEVGTNGTIEYINQAIFHNYGITKTKTGNTINIGNIIHLNDMYFTLTNQICDLYFLAKQISEPGSVEVQIRCSGLSGTRLLPFELRNNDLIHRISKRQFYKPLSNDVNDFYFNKLLLPDDIPLEKNKLLKLVDEKFSPIFEDFWLLADIYNSVSYDTWRADRISMGWI